MSLVVQNFKFLELLQTTPLPNRTSCPAEAVLPARLISCGGVSAKALIKAVLRGDKAISPELEGTTAPVQVPRAEPVWFRVFCCCFKLSRTERHVTVTRGITIVHCRLDAEDSCVVAPYDSNLGS